MTKKKIFVAVTNDISTDNRVHKIATFLLNKNFSVTVYGRVLPDTISIERPYKVLRKRHFFNHNFLFYTEYNIRLFFFLLFSKYNTILSNDLDTLPACFFASKIKRVNLVYDSHELFSEGPELQGRKFVKGFWKRLERYFLPKIKNAYTVSNAISTHYNNLYSNNMGVVRNLPFLHKNTEKLKVSFPTENKVILYQGVLNPGRGLKLTIQALHFLENVDLVIIGYGKVEAELKKFVVSENMEKRVHFLGRIPHEILLNYTKKATIGIVLEEPLGKSFEFSLPNKLFDYIHAELPIVAGKLPEIKKIITAYKVGVIIEEYTPHKIAEKIAELLTSEELMTSIKINQKAAKKTLNWENETKQLEPYFN